MFLEKTSQKVRGYLQVTVCGFFVERFFNLVSQANISVWKIEKKEEVTATFCTNQSNYQALLVIAHKTGCKLSINQKIGIPFYFLKHHKRKIFLLSFILVMSGIYFYQLHIWQIQITGDFQFPIEEIQQELEKENIRVGTLKSHLDIPYIKNNIYMRRHDIAWIGIHLKGTTAMIEVIEAHLKPEEKLEDIVPCNIVADKEGKIVELNVLEGVPMVRSGEYVVSGEVLISGVIKSDWSQDRYVNSKGEIKIKKWYVHKEVFPLERDIVAPTGKEQNYYELQYQKYKINFGNSSTKFEKYDTMVTERYLNLEGKVTLPLKFKQTTYREMGTDTVKYTEKQATEYALKQIQTTLLKQIEKKGEVVHTEMKTYCNDNQVTVVVTIEVIEKVGMKVKLEG